MAISEAYQVDQDVDGTEWDFTADAAYTTTAVISTDGVYQGFFDVNAFAAGDQFQFRVYEKAKAAGTLRVVYEAILTGAQSTPLFVTPSLVLLHGWTMTWKRLAGSTARAIVGSIRSVA